MNSIATPVIFPSGRDSDLSHPERTGSSPPNMIMGMVEVARRAPSLDCGLGTRIGPDLKIPKFCSLLSETCRVTPAEAAIYYEVFALFPSVFAQTFEEGSPKRGDRCF